MACQVPNGPAPPGLSIGTHGDVGDGACLMEVVSQTAGEPWTDSPACTHPLLAQLARLVNDNLPDHPRQSLHQFVPALVASRNEDPAADPRLALACTEYAIRQRNSMWLWHLRRAAAVRLQRESRVPFGTHNWVTIGRRRLYRSGPATHAVKAAVAAVCALPDREREVALLDLLELGVRVIAGHSGAQVFFTARRPGFGFRTASSHAQPPDRRPTGPDGTPESVTPSPTPGEQSPVPLMGEDLRDSIWT